MLLNLMLNSADALNHQGEIAGRRRTAILASGCARHGARNTGGCASTGVRPVFHHQTEGLERGLGWLFPNGLFIGFVNLERETVRAGEPFLNSSFETSLGGGDPMSLQTLVIDDEKAFGEMMALVLQKEGYLVTVVDFMEQGLEHSNPCNRPWFCAIFTCRAWTGWTQAARERGLECTTIMMSASWEFCRSARGHEVGGVRLYFKTL